MRAMNFTLVAAALTMSATTAHATTAVVYGGFDAGFANFATLVSGAGGTQINYALTPGSSGTPLVTPAFSIARNNGGSVVVNSPYQLYQSSPTRFTTGGVIDISPAGGRGGILSKPSGITFTFAAGINALGFEVGDWATCCQQSDLYIQFGANAPIRVGSSTVLNDQFLTNGGAGVFVSAFDDSATFNTISFWGDGLGEFLVAGGTIRYATLGFGTLPPDNGVPEPATWALLITGFGMVGSALRRRRPALAA